MICKYCGKEIPDNSEYCEFCNESLIEKVVLDDKALIRAKENRRREESPIFIRAYYKAKESSEEKKLRKEKELIEAASAKKDGKKPAKVYTGAPFYKKKKARLLAIGLSILPVITIIASFFMNWIYMWVKLKDKIEMNTSLKALVSKGLKKEKFDGYSKGKAFADYVPLICMIMMILAAIYILYLALQDLMPENKIPKDPLLRRHGFIARLIPAVLLIAAVIIITHCKLYLDTQRGMLEVQDAYSTFIGFDPKTNMGSGKGLGFLLGCASPVLYLISKAYVFVINTLNEDV